MAAKEPRNKTWGGFTSRPRRSANFREMAKHGDRHLEDRRPAADTVSRRPSVRVFGGFASRKWFVSLTGDIPTRPLPRGRGKSQRISHRRNPRQRERSGTEGTRKFPSSPTTFSGNPGALASVATQTPESGNQQIRSSLSQPPTAIIRQDVATLSERRNLIQSVQNTTAEAHS